MKNKLLMVFVLLFGGLANFSASAEWYKAEVVIVGEGPGGVYMRLNDRSARGAAFSNRRFRIENNIATTGLAIGMAAVTSKRLVIIESNADQLTESELAIIREIYLTDESSLQ